MIKSKKGFTLAEVLITLGIIGVVAALTLPNLIADYRDKADVAKVKQAYSLISQAYFSAVAKHGEISSWDNAKNMRDYLAEEMQISDKYDNTWLLYKIHDFKSLNGNQIYNSMIMNPGFRANNGMVFIFSTFFNNLSNCSGTGTAVGDYCAIIRIDINGKNGPNQYGFDAFELMISKDNKIKARGSGIDRCNPNKDTTTDGHGNGESCISWILQEGNMDYKKCLRGIKKYCEVDYNKYNKN